jgi:hypothetical protein
VKHWASSPADKLLGYLMVAWSDGGAECLAHFATGSTPKVKANDVIRIGRSRVRAATTAASKRLWPCGSPWRSNSTIRIPLFGGEPLPCRLSVTYDGDTRSCFESFQSTEHSAALGYFDSAIGHNRRAVSAAFVVGWIWAALSIVPALPG